MNYSQSLRIPAAAAEGQSLLFPSQPGSGPVTSLPAGSGVSLVGVLISKYLFIHPIRNLVQANTEVLGICKQQLREARVLLQNVA